jgi:glutamate carboxypeptidase
MKEPADILKAVQSQSNWLATTLRDLVLVESPSNNKPAVDEAVHLVASLARSIGGRVKLYHQKHFGDVLELRFGPARSAIKPILLLGHLDTVWPLGTLRTMPWRKAFARPFTASHRPPAGRHRVLPTTMENTEARGELRFYGPGVLDMKSGVVMALAAIRALAQFGVSRPVTLLLNSDEEVGSPVSRPITERLALESMCVLVLEAAQGLACKTARKGVGDYRLHVTGVASHSGVDFTSGHSAILELARLLQTVAGFTEPKLGRTVNPGVISGGTRSNVVAEHAFADIDVRIARASDAARVDRLFRSLRCTDPGCKLEITGGINRPPMERKPGTVALYKRARRLAAELGFQLDEASTGGGSDGNFTAALGVPTLDGLGAVGEGAHAAHESILIDHLVPRTALLAALLASL